MKILIAFGDTSPTNEEWQEVTFVTTSGGPYPHGGVEIPCPHCGCKAHAHVLVKSDPIGVDLKYVPLLQDGT